MKIKRIKIGIYILIIIGIIIIYEYRLREYKQINLVECYELKQGITITKGEELKANMFKQINLENSKLPDDYVKTLINVENKVALENMYESDILRNKKIEDKSKWCKDDERIVWLTTKGEEGIAANDLRPGDVIDLFIYDPLKKNYILESDFIGLEIQDLKDKDSVNYSDNKNKIFVISSLCFKMGNEKYNKLVDLIKSANNDFKVAIHGNRPQTGKQINEDNAFINTLK